MKKTILLAALLSLMPAMAHAQKQTVVTETTIEVGKERPFWKKLVRGTARVITLGAVQAATPTLRVNEPFTFAFDHDGIDTDSYSVFVNAALNATKSVGALTNGTVSFPFPTGLGKGTYSFLGVATGPGGEAVSDPISALVSNKPSKPTNPRIVR